jgi:hypothetical protein
MSFITSPGVIVPPLTAGGVAYGTGSQAKVTSAGTVGQVLTSAGAGVPIFTTPSSVTFPVTVPQGGTNLTTLTANNVILGNGTSAPTFVAPGTSGNVLASNGTTWQSATPSSGALTLLATVNAAGAATADFTTQITSTYDMYMITAQGVSLGGGASYAAMRFFVNSVIRATSYGIAALYMDSSGINNRGVNNQNRMDFTNATNQNVGGVFYIYRGNTVDHATTTFNISGGDGVAVSYLGGGTLNDNVQINGIRLFAESGTFTSALFRLYGIAKT